MINRVLLFICGMCLITACRQTQSLPAPVAVPKVDTVVVAKDSVATVAEPVITERDTKEAIEDLSFKYLKAKSRVVWKSGNNQDNYTVDIRVKKDSLIWVNISQAGISGAVGKFTRDRLQFYQKISSEYMDMTYDSLSTILGFRVNYTLLQSLIVGNQPFKKNNTRVIRENDNIIIKQNEGRIKIDNMVGPNRKLKKLLLNDVPTNNTLVMDFAEFTNLNQVVFPYSSLITLDVKNKENRIVNTVISIKYSKVELMETPLEFPFRVPAKFLNK